MTILVIASNHDLHADAVVDSIDGTSDCIRIDPLEHDKFCCTSDAGAFFLGETWVRTDEVSGIYCRFALELLSTEAAGHAISNFARAEALGALRGALLSVPWKRWINFPWYENAADGKIRPLLLARQLGCQVPPFIVTNDFAQLDLWIEANGDDLIIKAITDAAIAQQRDKFVEIPDFMEFSAPYTAKFDRKVLNTSNTDSTPFLIQKRVEKIAERRVVVLDHTVFATETCVGVGSPVDIRLKTDRVETSCEVPESDRRALLDLRKQLRLRFMTVDFAVDSSGVAWLLDINPQGNWLWQEQQLALGIPSSISAALNRSYDVLEQ